MTLQFRNAVQLRCFRHLQTNIERHLQSAVSSAAIQLFINDIFEADSTDGPHHVGLVDCHDVMEFEEQLEDLEPVWEKREKELGSAPEYFQKRMSTILSDLNGVLLMDDILVFDSSQKEHDERLTAVLKCIQDAGVTLNPEKCEFSKTQFTFLGHVIDHGGISADPLKTAANTSMSAPTNTSELRWFLGMVNQLGKFSPHISELTQPLRELLSKKQAWLWGPSQENAFAKVKAELATTRVLAMYNPEADIKISADASSYGLGAVLLQKCSDGWHPVAYASRAMTETEGRYAQIKKEVLAVTWACEKFATYILGKKIQLETDHKPLVPLLSHKHLDNLPPRVLHFRLRLMRFDFTVLHVPRKFLYTADALSRCPQKQTPDSNIIARQDEAESFVAVVTS